MRTCACVCDWTWDKQRAWDQKRKEKLKRKWRKETRLNCWWDNREWRILRTWHWAPTPVQEKRWRRVRWKLMILALPNRRRRKKTSPDEAKRRRGERRRGGTWGTEAFSMCEKAFSSLSGRVDETKDVYRMQSRQQEQFECTWFFLVSFFPRCARTRFPKS